MMVATGRFYTRGVRAVHKTEHLSAVFGSITPVTPSSHLLIESVATERGPRYWVVNSLALSLQLEQVVNLELVKTIYAGTLSGGEQKICC